MKKLSPLHIALVLLALSSPLHVSSTEPGHGILFQLYFLHNAIHVDEAEFMHAGSMGFVLNDYPASGANNRHSPYPGGTR
ncbi:hypothetical protein SORBI_3008G137901 [Sorghum bicolor]|uniref:Dirigent protein n=1 Tax=Sorghum bicolor TaxID=4558 RepID=A0A1Z5R742_SORBI|nr:hypothetical protein SORBI_3008G137901 [Sorghum bicolor]